MFNANRILVPVDFSPESELALEWAIRIAKEEPEGMIALCHVLPNTIMPVGPEAVAFDYSDYFEQEKKAATKKLKELRARVPKRIFSSVSVGSGAIASEIQSFCEKQCIDLVVMTTRARKGLSRLLHGSTTEETVRLAPCPVLVLHLNQNTQEALEPVRTRAGKGS